MTREAEGKRRSQGFRAGEHGRGWELGLGLGLGAMEEWRGVGGEVEGIPPAGCACHLPLTREAKGNRGFRAWG